MHNVGEHQRSNKSNKAKENGWLWLFAYKNESGVMFGDSLEK